MKSKKSFLILLLAFVLVLVLSGALYSKLGSDSAPEQLATSPANQTEGTQPPLSPAPDITVYDLQGKEVRLSDYVGKPVILNFWASWCGPCQMEMPDFQKKFEEYGESIQFLMVNMTDGSRETVKIASDFIAGQGYTFPVFYDTAYDAATTYRVYSLPTTYFIDVQGNLIAQGNGALSADALQQGIDMILP